MRVERYLSMVLVTDKDKCLKSVLRTDEIILPMDRLFPLVVKNLGHRGTVDEVRIWVDVLRRRHLKNA